MSNMEAGVNCAEMANKPKLLLCIVQKLLLTKLAIFEVLPVLTFKGSRFFPDFERTLAHLIYFFVLPWDAMITAY